MTVEDQAADPGLKATKWDDPDIPAGDSPRLPSWPLWVSGVLWCGWVCFLVTIALSG